MYTNANENQVFVNALDLEFYILIQAFIVQKIFKISKQLFMFVLSKMKSFFFLFTCYSLV